MAFGILIALVSVSSALAQSCEDSSLQSVPALVWDPDRSVTQRDLEGACARQFVWDYQRRVCAEAKCPSGFHTCAGQWRDEGPCCDRDGDCKCDHHCVIHEFRVDGGSSGGTDRHVLSTGDFMCSVQLGSVSEVHPDVGRITGAILAPSKVPRHAEPWDWSRSVCVDPVCPDGYHVCERHTDGDTRDASRAPCCSAFPCALVWGGGCDSWHNVRDSELALVLPLGTTRAPHTWEEMNWGTIVLLVLWAGFLYLLVRRGPRVLAWRPALGGERVAGGNESRDMPHDELAPASRIEKLVAARVLGFSLLLVFLPFLFPVAADERLLPDGPHPQLLYCYDIHFAGGGSHQFQAIYPLVVIAACGSYASASVAWLHRRREGRQAASTSGGLHLSPDFLATSAEGVAKSKPRPSFLRLALWKFLQVFASFSNIVALAELFAHGYVDAFTGSLVLSANFFLVVSWAAPKGLCKSSAEPSCVVAPFDGKLWMTCLPPFILGVCLTGLISQYLVGREFHPVLVAGLFMVTVFKAGLWFRRRIGGRLDSCSATVEAESAGPSTGAGDLCQAGPPGVAVLEKVQIQEVQKQGPGGADRAGADPGGAEAGSNDGALAGAEERADTSGNGAVAEHSLPTLRPRDQSPSSLVVLSDESLTAVVNGIARISSFLAATQLGATLELNPFLGSVWILSTAIAVRFWYVAEQERIQGMPKTPTTPERLSNLAWRYLIGVAILNTFGALGALLLSCGIGDDVAVFFGIPFYTIWFSSTFATNLVLQKIVILRARLVSGAQRLSERMASLFRWEVGIAAFLCVGSAVSTTVLAIAIGTGRATGEGPPPDVLVNHEFAAPDEGASEYVWMVLGFLAMNIFSILLKVLAFILLLSPVVMVLGFVALDLYFSFDAASTMHTLLEDIKRVQEMHRRSASELLWQRLRRALFFGKVNLWLVAISVTTTTICYFAIIGSLVYGALQALSFALGSSVGAHNQDVLESIMGFVFGSWLADSLCNDICVLFVGFAGVTDALEEIRALARLKRATEPVASAAAGSTEASGVVDARPSQPVSSSGSTAMKRFLSETCPSTSAKFSALQRQCELTTKEIQLRGEREAFRGVGARSKVRRRMAAGESHHADARAAEAAARIAKMICADWTETADDTVWALWETADAHLSQEEVLRCEELQDKAKVFFVDIYSATLRLCRSEEVQLADHESALAQREGAGAVGDTPATAGANGISGGGSSGVASEKKLHRYPKLKQHSSNVLQLFCEAAILRPRLEQIAMQLFEEGDSKFRAGELVELRIAPLKGLFRALEKAVFQTAPDGSKEGHAFALGSSGKSAEEENGSPSVGLGAEAEPGKSSRIDDVAISLFDEARAARPSSSRSISTLDGSGILDIVRGSVVCKSFAGLNEAISKFTACDKIRILLLRDRFKNQTAGGWCDVVVNFAFVDDPNAHIMEMQFIHEKMLLQRRNLGGHKWYVCYRVAGELAARGARLRNLEAEANESRAAQTAGIAVVADPPTLLAEEVASSEVQDDCAKASAGGQPASDGE